MARGAKQRGTVHIRPQFRLTVFCCLLLSLAIAAAEDNPNQKLDSKFQSAVSQYDAGHFSEAASQLEELLPYAPKSFEIHELLGLVYAAQSQDPRALPHFQMAVRLKPDSAGARTNLAASLVRTGNPGLAEEQFRKALELEPRDYEATHDLAEFYIQSEKIPEAPPFLEAAQQI